MDAPTFAMAMREVSTVEVFANLSKAITNGMALFNDGQRLPVEQGAVFADTIIEEYPHESLADVVVFLRRAALGKYGEEGWDGQTLKKGQTFGALTLAKVMEWWRQYLGEKAEALEAERTKANGSYKLDLSSALHPKVMDVAKELSEKVSVERAENNKAARLEKIRRTVGSVTDDGLRELYALHTAADERSIIIGEADKRGLLAKAMNQTNNEAA